MRKLASVVRIASCDPIANSDRLSVATMEGKGWKVVTGRDEFKPGEIAVYFEIDSYLPADDERYAFLRDRCLRKFVSKSGQVLREGIRIKTVKLRGVISQGLLMPISAFPEITPEALAAVNPDIESLDWEHCVGTDLTTLLNISHYDEIKAALAPQTSISIPSDAKLSDFPTAYCPKSDEERLQGLTDYFDTMRGRHFEVSEKRDGSSLSFGYCPLIDQENPFMVCSRNMRLKPVTGSGEIPAMWKIVQKMGLDEKCKDVPNLMFQSEYCGPACNGNRDLLTDFTIEVYRIYDVEKQEFVEASARRQLCSRMDIPHVPIIREDMDVFSELHTMDEALAFADGKTARGNLREGLVFKEIGTTHPVTFKVVSNKYLMKECD